MPTTSPSFDAFDNWLGVPAEQARRNYYLLLGVESSADAPAIRKAAGERTAIVRPRCLKFRQQGTEVLNEIAKARVCLTDPERRATYDETLAQAAQPAAAGVIVERDVTRLAARLRCELSEHKGPVSSVAFDPQGLLLASSAHDGTTKIWNVAKGKLRTTLKDSEDQKSRMREVSRGHKTRLATAVFSPDGAYFATAGDDTTPKLWDVNAGTLRQVLEKKRLATTKQNVTALAFQPKTSLLVVGYRMTRAQVWDVEEGKFCRAVAGATKDLAFSPDGSTLVLSSSFWDFESGERTGIFEADQGSANCLCFSPDGNYVVTGTATGVHFWLAETGQLERTLSRATAAVRSLAFSPCGQVIAAGAKDGHVDLWSVADGRNVFRFKAHATSVEGVAVSPDGAVLATGGDDTQVRLWDLYEA